MESTYTPLRRRSISNGRLTPAHEESPAKHAPAYAISAKYFKQFSKIAFVSLLLIKVFVFVVINGNALVVGMYGYMFDTFCTVACIFVSDSDRLCSAVVAL
jgi:hypothetical protein